MSSLSSKYDSSFNGTGFFELFSGSFSADESAEADATAIHYPGSNDNAVKDGGNGIRTITVAFAADSTDYNTLKGLLGSTHTLVCRSNDISSSAFLKSYSAGKLTQHDIYKGSFTFWIT